MLFSGIYTPGASSPYGEPTLASHKGEPTAAHPRSRPQLRTNPPCRTVASATLCAPPCRIPDAVRGTGL